MSTTAGPIAVTLSANGRVVVLTNRNPEENSNIQATQTLLLEANQRVTAARSEQEHPKASCPQDKGFARAALYDGELSATREAEGFGSLTFSNGAVYRGAVQLCFKDIFCQLHVHKVI